MAKTLGDILMNGGFTDAESDSGTAHSGTRFDYIRGNSQAAIVNLQRIFGQSAPSLCNFAIKYMQNTGEHAPNPCTLGKNML